ncbi:hypothetical protein LUZ60_001007 [Juncus effusus]|nr:hypothetical protein LUZ60_001007 [Juncus effusus]
MGEEGNLNLGLQFTVAGDGQGGGSGGGSSLGEENLYCSLTDIFAILEEDAPPPSSPPATGLVQEVQENSLFESMQSDIPNTSQVEEGQNMWGMEEAGVNNQTGVMTMPLFKTEEELNYGNFLGQHSDPDNFYNETDTEQWMSSISNCELNSSNYELNLNLPVKSEGNLIGENQNEENRWGDFGFDMQKEEIDIQPQQFHSSSSYFGVGDSSQSCMTDPNSYNYTQFNPQDQTGQIYNNSNIPLKIEQKIEEEREAEESSEEEEEEREELSDNMYVSVSDISDIDDSIPSSTDSSPLPSSRNSVSTQQNTNNNNNNPVKKRLDMDSNESDDDVAIIENMKDQNVIKKPPFTIPEKSYYGPNQPPFMHPFAMRYKSYDERSTLRLALQDMSQPKSEAVPPEGSLSVSLLRHQRIALAWMIHKETRNPHCSGGILADDQGLGKTVSTISLILTERSPPHSPSIPIKCETLNLDDDDDDDITNPNKKLKLFLSPPIPSVPAPPAVTNRVTAGRLAAGTLVVCPTSVLRQWGDELERKVSKEAKLTYLVYHGSGRTRDVNELAKYDVVLTTYSIVTMEAPKQPIEDEDEKSKSRGRKIKLLGGKKRKNQESENPHTNLAESIVRPLGKVNWYRVVLDEAQSIKNHRTQVARACWSLRAKRRWCLSGTPMQNSVDDLFSYFRFLRYEPYSSLSAFNEMIKHPISKHSQTGYKKLQAVLKTIMLRRTKGTLLDGMPIINLPSKTVGLKTVRFSPDERSFYSALEAASRAQFKVYADAGTVKQNYVNILLMLLRLRQACNHPLLVKGCNTNVNWRSSVEATSKLPKEQQEHLLSCLEASSAICALCNDAPEDAVVTTCGHVFCNQCISERLTGGDDTASCPACKSRLSFSSLFSQPTLKSSLSGTPIPVKQESDIPTPAHLSVSCTGYSSKIRTALQILRSLPPLVKGGDVEKEEERITKGVSEKAIVFSQWTSMLDLMEPPLKESGLEYRRLDGTMSVAARDKAVKDFNTIPEVTVMMMSLKAASLGLNMVAANHVILLDLWWNPTTEDQAIDRAHRIGQTRPVTVSRLTVENTVEDRILALQQKKREMVASAFGEDETGSHTTRLTVEDLEYLFRA